MRHRLLTATTALALLHGSAGHAGKSCTIALRGDNPVVKACQEGGIDAARKVMKALRAEAKDKGMKVECDTCHKNEESWALSDDAPDKFQKLLEVTGKAPAKAAASPTPSRAPASVTPAALPAPPKTDASPPPPPVKAADPAKPAEPAKPAPPPVERAEPVKATKDTAASPTKKPAAKKPKKPAATKVPAKAAEPAPK